ncbi:hypothetical protein ACCO45_010790 [Purpureocillium lilacinum]|uniref:Uncharacterized protein n=1 Tax=Purpureocillium lilacinum TaxID=33203 RepID=A0ACC4DGH5_PURLI
MSQTRKGWGLVLQTHSSIGTIMSHVRALSMAYSHAEVSVAWMRYDGNRVSPANATGSTYITPGNINWLQVNVGTQLGTGTTSGTVSIPDSGDVLHGVD